MPLTKAQQELVSKFRAKNPGYGKRIDTDEDYYNHLRIQAWY